MKKDFKQLSLIKELLIGFCLGTANIIPGVSGGTFLLIFKIYERVFSILDNINRTNILEFLRCIIRIVFKARGTTGRSTALLHLRRPRNSRVSLDTLTHHPGGQ